VAKEKDKEKTKEDIEGPFTANFKKPGLFIILIIKNPKEAEILEMAFNQFTIKTQKHEPNYSAYLTALQYKPDIILMDIPGRHSEQLRILRHFKNNRKTKTIPVITYGSIENAQEVNFILKQGAKQYLHGR